MTLTRIAATAAAVALSGSLAAMQSPQPPAPQDCIRSARDFTTKRLRELGPITAEISRKIMTERTEMVRSCAAAFDADKARPADIAALVDLYVEAQEPELAEKAVARGLSMDLTPPQRGELLASAVRALLRQPKSEARNAKAESYVDALDALPPDAIASKLASHIALNGYYRGDDIDAGIIRHSTWLIEQAKTLSPAARKTYGPPLVSAYVSLAEALAGQGENDRALDLLKRAPVELADVPNVEMRTNEPLARYTLVGTPAKPITAPAWLNRDAAAGPLDFAGAVTLVQFTAHWCGPCRESYPGMQRLRDRFKGRAFREVFVTRPYGFFEKEQNLAPEQEIERDRRYFAQFGFDIPIAIGVPAFTMADGKRTSQQEPNETAFSVTGIPQINVVDKRGTIRLIMIGYDDANEAKLGAFIDKLLAEK